MVILLIVTLVSPVGAEEPVAPCGLNPIDEPRPDVPPGNRWAMLIGIDKYTFMSKLNYCGRDMDRLRDVLIRQGGYARQRIRLLCDSAKDSLSPSSGTIYTALDTFLKQARPEDTVLLASSGHGEFDPEGKQNFLMPIDGNPRLLKQTGIPIEIVNDLLRQCSAKQKVVIIDACHSGGDGQKGGDAGRFDPDSFKIPEASPGEGIVQLFSCGQKQVSWEDKDLGQGVFSHFLSRALEGDADKAGNRDGDVSAEEVYEYTSREVSLYVGQKMHALQSPYRKVSGAGRFVLATRAGEGDEVPDPKQILARLDDLRHQGVLSAELVADARLFLGSDPSFGPSRTMRHLFWLLAQNAVTERQFQEISREKTNQLRSHSLASQMFRTRKLYSIHIGINSYIRPLSNLLFCVNDAKMLHELLAPACRESGGDSIMITEALATEREVRRAILDRKEKARVGDILLITFSGRGYLGDNRRPRGTQDSGWLLHEFRLKSTTDGGISSDDVKGDTHRGLVKLDLIEERSQNDGILMAGELEALLEDSPASVVIASDACFARLTKWNELIDYSLVTQSEVNEALADRPGPAERAKMMTRVFIGFDTYAQNHRKSIMVTCPS